jgi:hypothetical protein
VARSIRSTALETRTGRLKLAQRWKPYTAKIAPGLRLAYRRNATAGRWSVICADGKGGNWLKAFANADDFEEANGRDILTFWQATEQARLLARGEGDKPNDPDRPVTVKEALANYRADLQTRGGDVYPLNRVRIHLPTTLAEQPVALLKATALLRWRDGLHKSLKPGSINRIANALRAALNMAADADERISRRAWEVGLKAVPGGTVARNVILPPEAIRSIVAESYAISEAIGLLVEVAAITGARLSQMARLMVQDLRGGAAPCLMMPVSKKGRGDKTVTHRAVAIPQTLALLLKQTSKGRPAHDPLLRKPSGEPWKRSDHTRLFARAVVRAGLDPDKATVYALRHSSIVRQLLANVPIRIVATAHDTSVAMIEKNYSIHIVDHADHLLRPTLLDLEPARDNVVPMGRKA